MESDRITKAFANTLIELRKEKELSQEKLANLCDLDRSNISRIERGQYGPTLITLFQLAKGLGIEVEELVIKVKEKVMELD